MSAPVSDAERVLREALSFYAYKPHYEPAEDGPPEVTRISIDDGQAARSALDDSLGAPQQPPSGDAGFDAGTETRWQDAIHELCDRLVPEARIDGSGCESGDALDVTLAEIRQVLLYFRSSRHMPTQPCVDADKIGEALTEFRWAKRFDDLGEEQLQVEFVALIRSHVLDAAAVRASEREQCAVELDTEAERLRHNTDTSFTVTSSLMRAARLLRALAPKERE